MSAPTQQTCFTYARRQPELTPCYQIIQNHLATFMAEREAEGRDFPKYIHDEFDSYLKCGILAHGFLRLACNSCDKEHVVAFSCKKRGFCPSCCAKRMVEAAGHLVDNVLPLVPYRQFVVSFPIPMRYWLHTNKKLFIKIHKIVITEISCYYMAKALAQGIKEPAPGQVSFTQRFGSALNLNVHLHILSLDGVYTMVGGKPVWRNLEGITDKEVAGLIEKISRKVIRHLRRRGYLDRDGEVVENPMSDPLFQDHESLGLASHRSIESRIAFGPNAGQRVTRIGSGFGYGEEIPLAKGRRCYSINGFSLHANTATKTHQRDRLEQLIQYIARGPLANERLEITAEGKVKLRLKTAFTDGTTHLLFTPGEFIEKLVALIPPPKTHLVRWGGVLAPHSPFRPLITLKPEIKKGFQFGAPCADEEKGTKQKNHTWSQLLARVFKIDVTKCVSCGGEMTMKAQVTESDSVRRYLKHVGLDPDPPSRAPPKVVSGDLGLDPDLPGETTELTLID